MWRSVTATRIAISRHTEAAKFVSTGIASQVLQHQPRTFPQLSYPHFSPWSIANFRQIPHRFLSHGLLNVLNEDTKELASKFHVSEPSNDGAFVDSPNMLDETTSLVSSEFKIDDTMLHSGDASLYDGANDNSEMDGFALVNDDSIGEDDNTPDVSSEKLECVLSLLQSSGSVDGSVESNLENMGLELNEEFLMRVLETKLVPGENLASFLKWVYKNQDFCITTRVVQALVQAICCEHRGRNAYILWSFIKEIGTQDKTLLNTDILNNLISMFSKLGRGKASFEVYNKFEEFECVPNGDTYYFTIEALCRRSITDLVSPIVLTMLKTEQFPVTEKIRKIISYMCKGGKAKDAYMLYTLARKKENLPHEGKKDAFARKCLVIALSEQDDTVGLALSVLDDFTLEQRKFAIQSFYSVIRGLCRIKDLDAAKGLLSKMIDAGPPPGNAIFNVIINGLSKAGDMEEAIKMLQVMEGRGLKPDVCAYTTIMSGFVKVGAMEEARKILSMARKKHSKLSYATYHTLIRGYCRLEQFDEALELFGEMGRDGVKPNADEYNKLVQSLCLKALDWKTSEQLLEQMKEQGLHLNGITKALIRAVKELEIEAMDIEELPIEA